MEEDKISGVYKIISPTGRIYIGSTINIKSRWRPYKNGNCKKQIRLYRSLLKYGWEAHKFEIIALIEPEKRYKWEHILGMYYDVLGENGLNCTLPGYEDVPMKISDETRAKMAKSQTGKKHKLQALEKLSRINKGKKLSDEHVEKLRIAKTGTKHADTSKIKMSESQNLRYEKAIHREVLQLNKNMEVLNEFQNCQKAAKATGINENNILRACSGQRHTAKGFIWRHKYDDPNRIFKERLPHPNKKAVCQFNLEGVLINEFFSITEASKLTNIDKTAIGENCKGLLHKAGGFIWRFKEDNKKPEIIRVKPFTPVLKIRESDLVVMHTYNSINEAARLEGINLRRIKKVCLGIDKLYNGFIWKYGQ